MRAGYFKISLPPLVPPCSIFQTHTLSKPRSQPRANLFQGSKLTKCACGPLCLSRFMLEPLNRIISRGAPNFPSFSSLGNRRSRRRHIARAHLDEARENLDSSFRRLIQVRSVSRCPNRIAPNKSLCSFYPCMCRYKAVLNSLRPTYHKVEKIPP